MSMTIYVWTKWRKYRTILIIHHSSGPWFICTVRGALVKAASYVRSPDMPVDKSDSIPGKAEWLTQSINQSFKSSAKAVHWPEISFLLLYNAVHCCCCVLRRTFLVRTMQCNECNAMQCKWIVDKSSCFQTFHIHEKLLVYYSYSLFITTTSTKTNTTRVKACKVK